MVKNKKKENNGINLMQEFDDEVLEKKLI